jgi:biopolymer transport protein ExbB/TolQ
MTPAEQFLVWGTIAVLIIICVVTIQIIKEQNHHLKELKRENEILKRENNSNKKLINELSENEATFRAAFTKFNNYMERLK